MIKVGEIKAGKGSKTHGFLKVGGRAVSKVELPVMIINGSSEGPKLCLTAAVHGNEYAGTAACMRIYNEVVPEKLSGAILIAPIVNVPGFESSVSTNNFIPSSFNCPIDQTDLMLVDPNEKEGWMSTLIAHTLFEEMIFKCDFYIDIHGVAFPKKGCNTVTIRISENEVVTKTSEELARLFPCRYIRVFDLYNLPPGASGTGFPGHAILKGIPTIQPEAGHAGEMDEPSIALIIDGIINVMKSLEMIEGTPDEISDQVMIRTEHVIRPKNGGIFFPKIEPESKVHRGQVVGEIKNPFGETIEELISPSDGMVIWYHFPPPVNSGDIIIKIGEID